VLVDVTRCFRHLGIHPLQKPQQLYHSALGRATS
jgi:hypothetical protein